MTDGPGTGDQQPWGAPPPSGPAVQPGWGTAPQWGGAPGQPVTGIPGPAWGGGQQSWLHRPKPGIIPLRPITLGEILDGAFQAIRTNPRTMIGVSAVVVAIATLVSVAPSAFLLTGLADSPLLEPGGTEDPAVLGTYLLNIVRASLPRFVVQFLTTAILGALLTVCVSNAVLGVRTGGGALWRRIRPRLGAVLGLAVLLGLLPLALVGLCVLPGVALILAGQTLGGVILVLLGMLPAIVIVLVLFARLGLAAPSLLLEDRGPAAAITRSWQLTRGSFWRVLGVLLLASVIQGIGAAVITTPFAAIAGVLTAFTSGGDLYAGFWSNVGQLLVSGVGEIIAGAVFYPFTAAVTTLLYLDLRMRREGLDVELVRQVEGGPTT